MADIIPGSADHVSGMVTAIQGVDSAVHLVFDGLSAAGVGGHLNETQIEGVVDLFSAMATKAIIAFHKAAGVPITHDSIMALLPADPTPLPAPDGGTGPVPVASTGAAPATPPAGGAPVDATPAEDAAGGAGLATEP